MVEHPRAFGRIVNHDPRSRGFAAPRATARQPVAHRIHGRLLNQGHLGACVGFAGAYALNTDPLHKSGEKLRTNTDGRNFYHEATLVDQWPGQWPPTDTGTDVNGLGQALRAKSIITGWTHCFGIDHTLDALQLGPVLIGVEWTQDMMVTDPDGFIHATGAVVGGHEVMLYADPCTGFVVGRCAWAAWGINRKGDFKLSYEDLADRLANDGDATFLVR